MYRARDTKLGREVAIKVLPGSLAEFDTLESDPRYQALLRGMNLPGSGEKK